DPEVYAYAYARTPEAEIKRKDIEVEDAPEDKPEQKESTGKLPLQPRKQPNSAIPRSTMLQAEDSERLSSSGKEKQSFFVSRIEQGSLMGNHLVDALALGMVISHGLYTPKVMEKASTRLGQIGRRITSRFGQLVRQKEEPRVATLTISVDQNGMQRLIYGSIEKDMIRPMCRRDIEAGVKIGGESDQSLVDYEITELIAQVKAREDFYANVVLVDERLINQVGLIKQLGVEVKTLVTHGLRSEAEAMSTSEQQELAAWLDQGDTPLPSRHRLSNLLRIRKESYSQRMSESQAAVAVMLELAATLSMAT
ncbi:MAG: hypothetical protein ACO32T_04935, partial [Candidatus Nanopelagicaceae bacterium]